MVGQAIGVCRLPSAGSDGGGGGCAEAISPEGGRRGDFGVTFFFITRMWKFQNASITFLLDGARVPLTKVLHDGSVLNGYQIMESVIAYPVPFATLRKIAAAKAVEVQIGTTEFTLSDESVAAFRAISRAIKISLSVPSGPAPNKSPAK